MKHLTPNSFQTGDKFTVASRGYYRDGVLIVFVVTKVFADRIDFREAGCADTTKVDDTFHIANLEFFANKIKIVSRASDDAAINRVSVRLSGESLAKGEKEFVKVQNALEKAVIEFRENKTIHFENGRLSFVSRESGKQRNVTKAGCWNSCECQNQMSYHYALYLICAEVAKAVSLPKAQAICEKIQENRKAA